MKNFVWILKNQRIHLERKKNRLPDYFLHNFFYWLVALLSCKISFLDVFNMIDVFQILVILRNTQNSDWIKDLVENVRAVRRSKDKLLFFRDENFLTKKKQNKKVNTW